MISWAELVRGFVVGCEHDERRFPHRRVLETGRLDLYPRRIEFVADLPKTLTAIASPDELRGNVVKASSFARLPNRGTNSAQSGSGGKQ